MRAAAGPGPSVGFIGAGLPCTLALAGGCAAIDVECLEAPSDMPAPTGELVEPFVDARVRRVLSQLASDRLAGIPALVFCRDDPVGHIAYIYSQELRRQGLISATPSFFLWNLVHRSGDAVRTFNKVQARRLEDFLVGCGGARWSEAALVGAIEREGARRTARRALIDATWLARISGSEAFSLWRAGGRLAPEAHAERIEATLRGASIPANGAMRIGLIGSPVVDPRLYRALERHGRIVADPHPAGLAAMPPAPMLEGDPLSAVLRAEAENPFALRGLPVARHHAAIVAACVAAGCEAVALQFDPNDDHVGWDAPALRRALRDAGISLVELGFVPAEPAALDGWVDEAMTASGRFA